MVTAVAEGTTLADGTAQSIYSTGLDATFQFTLDISAMQGGDTLTVSIISNLSIIVGSKRTVYSQTFSGAPSGAGIVQVGPPLPCTRLFEVQIQQTAGVNRSYPWRVDTLGIATEVGSGSALPASTAETELFNTATPGIYVLAVNLSTMQAGEIVTLRAYETIVAAGAQKLAYQYITPTGVQVTPNILMFSLPLGCPYGGKFTLQQNTTNSRSYSWIVFKVSD